jgi:hypothetical protein
MTTIANPYANLELRIPMREWEGVRRFTMTFRPEDGSKAEIDQSPFNRYVDLWWAALCIGVREERATHVGEWHTFVTGVVLNQEPWRIRQLELIALAKAGDVAILQEPGRVVTIANEYAATGIPILLDAMVGQVDPIWAVTGVFRRTVEDAQASITPIRTVVLPR